MSELTYIFGAGASYKAMPLVENFPHRFEYFITAIERTTITQFGDDFLKICKNFLKEIQSHLSFDTFFKKLFHQGEEDTITNYKAILLIFFLFEQLMDLSEIKKFDKAGLYNKTALADPRYEALIAGLLKPIKGKSEFYTKVNFITWNYDTNFLYSIKNFFTKNSHLDKFIGQVNKKENYFKISDQIELTHLNGFVTHPMLNNLVQLDGYQMTGFLNLMIGNYYMNKREIQNYSKFIKFSWESIISLKEFPDFIQNARAMITNSSNVIVIGYSFPLYNRLVDTHLLNGDTLRSKKLIIQDPQANDLKNILLSDFGLIENRELGSSGFPITEIKCLTNCNSFFVPNSIFQR